MAIGSYVLCVILSAACAWLLLRQYRQLRLPLLLWSGLCFAALCAAHILVIIDLVWLVQVDLFVWRNLVTLVAVLLLLYGAIWEVR